MERDRLRQVAVVASTIGGIALGLTGDYGSEQESASLVIPAAYAFAIWGPIYVGALAYAIYQALPSTSADPLLRRVGWPIAAAYLGAGLWSRVFPLEQLWLTVALIGATMGAAALAYTRLDADGLETNAEAWLVRVPVGLFTGWITLATAAGTTEALLAENVGGLVLGATPWALVVLLVAGTVGAAVTWRVRGLAYPVAVTWGLVGAAVQQLADAPLPAATAAAMAALVAATARGAVRRDRANAASGRAGRRLGGAVA